MKPITLLGLFCLLLFAGCESNHQKLYKLKDKFVGVISDKLKSEFKVKIDSVIIEEIDTLSDSVFYAVKCNKIQRQIPEWKDQSHNMISQLNHYNSEAIEYRDNANMNLETPDWNQVRQQQIDSYNSKLNDIKEAKRAINKFSDTLNMIADEFNRDSSLLHSKNINKHNFRGYYIRYKLLGAEDNNNQIKLDSLQICISPSFRIINFETTQDLLEYK